jgi:SAM-dependent methyltransferase
MPVEDLGKSGRFEELRSLLESASFTEKAICTQLGLKQLSDFENHPSRRPVIAEAASACDVLIRLFIISQYEACSAVERFLCPQGLPLLEEMGMLVRDGERCYSTVTLYPIGDLFIASDRWSNPDDSLYTPPRDVVYPAIVENTRLFLNLLPSGSRGVFLDVGAGTGAAALAAAKSGSDHAWASDIADRCTRFAEFNGRMNGLTNFTAVTSDLYAGLGDQTFDRIVSHPPYVPTLSPTWVFHSGGEDGEQITRGVVEGLPQRLRDGGVFCCLTLGSDRKNRPFECRIREWLGERQGDFDVALVVRRTVKPEDYANRAHPLEQRRAHESQDWLNLFGRLEIETLAYGLIVIQRRNGALRPFTVRRQAPAQFRRDSWEWMLAWETAAAREDLPRLILDSRLGASRRTQFQVLHKLDDEGWTPREFVLQTDWPFEMSCQAQPWMAHLISLCDGKATGRDYLRMLQENEAIPAGISENEFADAVAPLVSGGFVEVEGFTLPQAAE